MTTDRPTGNCFDPEYVALLFLRSGSADLGCGGALARYSNAAQVRSVNRSRKRVNDE
jgi:hypothetical protein